MLCRLQSVGQCFATSTSGESILMRMASRLEIIRKLLCQRARNKPAQQVTNDKAARATGGFTNGSPSRVQQQWHQAPARERVGWQLHRRGRRYPRRRAQGAGFLLCDRPAGGSTVGGLSRPQTQPAQPAFLQNVGRHGPVWVGRVSQLPERGDQGLASSRKLTNIGISSSI